MLTGAGGMLGSSIAEAWQRQRPDDEIVGWRSADLDLRDAAATRAAMSDCAPDLVIHAAARVGGIADKVARPLPYLLDNLRIDSSVIDAATRSDVPRMLYIASAAVYPASATNPIREGQLFSGRLEPANEGYGLAKLAGLTAVGYASSQDGRAYRSLLPSNLYGPRDTFHPERAHLIASALRKTHEAAARDSETVEVWGDGTARREFTYAPDLAGWIAGEIESIDSWPSVMNIGAGVDHSIREYYEIARDVVGYSGRLDFDESKPSGVPQRLLDSTSAREHGWHAQTTMADGMTACYESYLRQIADGDIR
nr:NAD-dependent epimerase/dehydratase family protein [Microbacterium pseudoresistens]